MQWPGGAGWLDYEAAIAEARRQRKPILLALSAPWCPADSDPFACAGPLGGAISPCSRGGHDLGEVRRTFILGRVDVERRPDLLRRYQPADLPTVMLLGSDGAVLLAGVPGWVARPSRQLAPAWVGEPRGAGPAGWPDLRPALSLVEGVLLTSLDATHGGFGSGPKHPEAYAIIYAADRYQATSSERWHEVFSLGLDGITQGLFDPRGGGFYRSARWRDWQDPNQAKLLGANAETIRAYVRAYEVTRRAGYLDILSRSLQFALTTLLGPAFRGSLDADGRLDETIYLPANEEMVGALCLAAQVIGEPRYAEVARQVQRYLLEKLFDPGRGFAHYFDGAPQLFGLALDNAAALVGLVRAATALEEQAYLAPARQAASLVLRSLLPGEAGAADRAPLPGPGGPVAGQLAFDDVVLAAEGLLWLGRLTGEAAYLRSAWQLAGRLVSELPGQRPGTAGRFGSLVQDLLAAGPPPVEGGGSVAIPRPTRAGWGSGR